MLKTCFVFYLKILIVSKIEFGQWLWLSIPEVSGSNPVIGKKIYWTLTVNCIEKTKIKKKGSGMAH